MAPEARQASRWLQILVVVGAPIGVVLLALGSLLVIGGLLYLSLGWRYGLVVAWLASALGLIASGLGLLLFWPLRRGICVIAAWLSLAGGLLLLALTRAIGEGDPSTLVFGVVGLLIAAVAAAAARFHGRLHRAATAKGTAAGTR